MFDMRQTVTLVPRRPLTNTATTVISLLTVGAIAFGCSSDSRQEELPNPQVDVSDTTQEQREPPCSDGAVRPCYRTLGQSGSVLSCYEGRQVCAEGTWGECADGTVVPRPAPDLDTLSRLRPNALSTAATLCTPKGTYSYTNPPPPPSPGGAGGTAGAPTPGSLNLAGLGRWEYVAGAGGVVWKASSNARFYNPCDPTCRFFETTDLPGANSDPMGEGDVGEIDFPVDFPDIPFNDCRYGGDCQFNQRCEEPASESACTHSKCEVGGPLSAACRAADPCVREICEKEPACCSSDWTQSCIDRVKTDCDAFCGVATTCAHELCVEGDPLDPSCDTCVADICDISDGAGDPACCSSGWDANCVQLVIDECGGGTVLTDALDPSDYCSFAAYGTSTLTIGSNALVTGSALGGGTVHLNGDGSTLSSVFGATLVTSDTPANTHSIIGDLISLGSITNLDSAVVAGSIEENSSSFFAPLLPTKTAFTCGTGLEPISSNVTLDNTTPHGDIRLSGTAQLSLQPGLYRIRSLQLADTSQLVLPATGTVYLSICENVVFSDQSGVTGNLSPADGLRLQIYSQDAGAFSPTIWLGANTQPRGAFLAPDGSIEAYTTSPLQALLIADSVLFPDYLTVDTSGFPDECRVTAFDDGSACSTDLDCDDGLYCNGTEVCSSGSCTAGTAVNCDDTISCTTDSCDEVANSCVHITDDAACNDGLYCNGPETCDAGFGCMAGTPVTCDDSVACTNDSCDEASDGCLFVADDTNCDNGVFCDGSETCDQSLGCQAGVPVVCNDGIPCTTDFCDAVADDCAVTTNDALCNDGDYCNGAEVCDALNGCEAGTAPNCDDSIACTLDSCNELADSCDHVADDTACDNSLYCDGPEVCNPSAGCQNTAAPCSSAACNEASDTCGCSGDADCDDGQHCNGTETCSAGTCLAGTPVACSDSISCTVDTCNEVTDSCDHTPNNGLCADGAFCNGVETCNPGVGCELGTAPCAGMCNDTLDICGCTTDADCDDSVYCNGAEICNAGTCEAGAPVVCDDSIGCTADSCNEGTNSCNHVPNDSACDNGVHCDGAEVCNTSAGCQSGPPVDCDDTNDCTLDSCNEASNDCDHVPSDSACDDGLTCNGSETCDAALGCLAGTPTVCDDGVGCTDDTCDEILGCTSTANDSNCDDGLYCTGTETCDDTLGCLTVDLCNGTCNEASDSCSETPCDYASLSTTSTTLSDGTIIVGPVATGDVLGGSTFVDGNLKVTGNFNMWGAPTILGNIEYAGTISPSTAPPPEASYSRVYNTAITKPAVPTAPSSAQNPCGGSATIPGPNGSGVVTFSPNVRYAGVNWGSWTTEAVANFPTAGKYYFTQFSLQSSRKVRLPATGIVEIYVCNDVYFQGSGSVIQKSDGTAFSTSIADQQDGMRLHVYTHSSTNTAIQIQGPTVFGIFTAPQGLASVQNSVVYGLVHGNVVGHYNNSSVVTTNVLGSSYCTSSDYLAWNDPRTSPTEAPATPAERPFAPVRNELAYGGPRLEYLPEPVRAACSDDPPPWAVAQSSFAAGGAGGDDCDGRGIDPDTSLNGCLCAYSVYTKGNLTIMQGGSLKGSLASEGQLNMTQATIDGSIEAWEGLSLDDSDITGGRIVVLNSSGTADPALRLVNFATVDADIFVNGNVWIDNSHGDGYGEVDGWVRLINGAARWRSPADAAGSGPGLAMVSTDRLELLGGEFYGDFESPNAPTGSGNWVTGSYISNATPLVSIPTLTPRTIPTKNLGALCPSGGMSFTVGSSTVRPSLFWGSPFPREPVYDALAPGCYGGVTVGSNGKLILRDGVYTFDDFGTQADAIIEIRNVGPNPIVINVKGNLSLGNRTQFVFTDSGADPASIDPTLVQWYVAGSGTVNVDQLTFPGIITAPSAHVRVTSQPTTVFNGMVYAASADFQPGFHTISAGYDSSTCTYVSTGGTPGTGGTGGTAGTGGTGGTAGTGGNGGTGIGGSAGSVGTGGTTTGGTGGVTYVCSYDANPGTCVSWEPTETDDSCPGFDLAVELPCWTDGASPGDQDVRVNVCNHGSDVAPAGLTIDFYEYTAAAASTNWGTDASPGSPFDSCTTSAEIPPGTCAQTNCVTVNVSGSTPDPDRYLVMVNPSGAASECHVDDNWSVFLADGTRLNCQYDCSIEEATGASQVPVTNAASLDLSSAVVKFTDGGVTTELPYSPDCSNADGWRFDVDPSSGTPTLVQLCTATMITGTSMLRAEVGCQRVYAPTTLATEEYAATCPDGRRVQWQFLTWEADVPIPSEIRFRIRPFTLERDGVTRKDVGTWVDLDAAPTPDRKATGQDSSGVDRSVCSLVDLSDPLCPVVLADVLEDDEEDYEALELEATIIPNGAATQPQLINWAATYSCIDNE